MSATQFRLLATAALALPFFAGSAFAQSAAPPAPAGQHQQSRMASCNADAKTQTLKGEARKTFMSECLSNKTGMVTPAALAAPTKAAATATDPAPLVITAPARSAKATAPAATPHAATTTGPVNINQASSEQLDGLWGIGKTRAATIIANRPYKSVEDLHARKLIPENVYDRIKDQIIVN